MIFFAGAIDRKSKSLGTFSPSVSCQYFGIPFWTQIPLSLWLPVPYSVVLSGHSGHKSHTALGYLWPQVSCIEWTFWAQIPHSSWLFVAPSYLYWVDILGTNPTQLLVSGGPLSVVLSGHSGHESHPALGYLWPLVGSTLVILLGTNPTQPLVTCGS